MKKFSQPSAVSPQALPPQRRRCAPVPSAGQSPSRAGHPLGPLPHLSQVVPPPAPLLTSVWALGSGCAVQGWRLGWGVRGEGGADGATAAQPQCHPHPPEPGPQPSRRPSPPGREPGPPARSANFFSPNAKTFSRSSRWRAAALPAGPSPRSYFPPSCRSVG